MGVGRPDQGVHEIRGHLAGRRAPAEDAVLAGKASYAVADRLGIRDRGLLRDRMYADVIVFDPATVRENATYTDPHKLSAGIRDVFVNGTPVLRDGLHTGALPGHRVNGPGYRA